MTASYKKQSELDQDSEGTEKGEELRESDLESINKSSWRGKHAVQQTAD